MEFPIISRNVRKHQSFKGIGFEGFFSSFATSIAKNEDQKTD
jgi:hypothetical protein